MMTRIARFFAVAMFLFLIFGSWCKRSHPEWGYTTYENGHYVHKNNGDAEREKAARAKKAERDQRALEKKNRILEARAIRNIRLYGNVDGPKEGVR
jgi:hypothetical protein